MAKSRNTELIEEIYAAFARGELAEDAFDPAVVWHQRADLPEARAAHGIAAVTEMVGGWSESFQDFRADVEAYIERESAVVVPLTLRGRIAGSDNEVEMDEVHVWTVRGGRVVEVREYRTRDEAFEALARAASQA